jgi:hypothetical protein
MNYGSEISDADNVISLEDIPPTIAAVLELTILDLAVESASETTQALQLCVVESQEEQPNSKHGLSPSTHLPKPLHF